MILPIIFQRRIVYDAENFFEIFWDWIQVLIFNLGFNTNF